MSGVLGILLTPQPGPRVFSAGAALAPFPAQPFSLPRPLFTVQPIGLPSSDLPPLEATKGRSPGPDLSASPRSSTPRRPRPQNCEVYRGARGSAPRLRFGKSLPHRNHRAPLSGTRTVGCGWVGCAAGTRSVLSKKEGDRPRNIPLFRKFPFRGHGVCARMARGAEGGGVGWTESQPDPWGACGGRERQTARSGLEAALPALNQGCHERLTLHASHPQPVAYRPHHSPPSSPKEARTHRNQVLSWTRAGRIRRVHGQGSGARG